MNIETLSVFDKLQESITRFIDKVKNGPRKSEAEIAQWIWDRETLPALRMVRLPARFQHERTEWNCKPQERVFKECKRLFTGTGAVVVLCGVRGTGKTEIASQLIIERAKNKITHPTQWPVPYTKLTDLIALFKPIYADFGSIETDKLTARRDQFCHYPLRIIDELQDCEDQRMKQRILTDIIDRCYSELTDTLLICNQTEEEFRLSAGDSVVSRISEHGRIIECSWNSFRTQN